jgi:redox-sensing transcriptional repressor
MPRTGQISDRVIGRLGLYRRLLAGLREEGAAYVFSHDLAARASVTAAQVRRDMMVLGYTGNPAKGYEVASLGESISQFLDAPDGQNAALVGIGNLGRALLAFFARRRTKLQIVAAFDRDPEKTNRVMHGYRCYSVEDMALVIGESHIDVGIITVPAGDAQPVAEAMVEAGVRGLLNFAPVKLRMPPGVYVEDIDMTVSLERVAFMARAGGSQTPLEVRK